ncbi:MAG: hypothetical protein R3B57_05430 [Phycisphaerales bacterium]
MTLLLAGYFYILAALVVGLMLRQYARGTHDLLSLRNVALAGFVVFQLTSAAQVMRARYMGAFTLHDPVQTGLAYAVWSTTFLVVFLVAYAWGPGVKRLAAKPNPSRTDVTDRTLRLFAIICLFSGAFFMVLPIPLVSLVTSKVGFGLMAIAAGLGGWMWARRPTALETILPSFTVLAAALASSMIIGFGRRPLIAVVGCFIFAAYFSRWRYLPPKAVIQRLAAVAIPAVLAVALFTSARGGLRDTGAGPVAQIKAVVTANPVEGLSMLADGQGAAAKSMWLMEQFPEQYEYRPFSTLLYAFYFPVPRSWWNDKPTTLSMDLPQLARVQRVNRDVLTLGPGAIGHAAVDGGFLVLIIYAVLAALGLRLADEIIVRHATQPLVVLPVACALGQVLGLSRGEAGVFASILAISIIGAWIYIAFVSKLLVRLGLVVSDAVAPFQIDDYRAEYDFEYYGSPEFDPDPPAVLPLEVQRIMRGESEPGRRAA